MNTDKYVIGLDYGTKSGRAILTNTLTGKIIAQAVKEYSHGVMDVGLSDWALQHPIDYIEVLRETIPTLLFESKVLPENIIGLSIDFTASTILPIKADGTPLCILDEFKNRPHAYVKLWKHHAAAKEAQQINELLTRRGEINLPRYGGKISSELMLPKVLQLLHEDPEIYEAADKIMEAADWINFILTGLDRRSASTAGYKAMWYGKEGYPATDLLAALDVKLAHFPEEKLSMDICPVGGKFGELNAEWAKKLGLSPGIAIGASIIDAHAGMPGCGITEPGQMLLIIGTSSVQAVLNKTPYSGEGICGAVKDGIMPGYYALESGLAGVGDVFAWFVENCMPVSYCEAARALEMNPHQYLTMLAEKLDVGESGLLALDWWNGNKTPFVDVNLSGMMLGYTLQTKPEEIYRALIEATGFGTKTIMEAFAKAGTEINEIRACGGIAEKNPMLMQIYSDITNREIKIAASEQTAALGAAIYAAVAAGASKGGYDNIFEAVKAMSSIKEKIYRPIPENVAIYSALYQEYKTLQKYFGEENNIMKKLKTHKF